MIAPKGNNRERLISYGLPLLILLLFVAIWEIVTLIFQIPRWLVPPPSAIAVALVNSAPLLFEHAIVTLGEVLIGFAIALSIGILSALIMSYSRGLERGIYPLVILAQILPILAIAPILIVWFGLGLWSKVVVVVLISFFPIVVSLSDGLKVKNQGQVDMLRSLGASGRQIMLKLRVPLALPHLFSGLKLAITAAVIGAVVGEWIGANAGLGYLMRIKSPLFQTDVVFAAIVVIALLTVALFGSVKLIERWVLRNHEIK